MTAFKYYDQCYSFLVDRERDRQAKYYMPLSTDTGAQKTIIPVIHV